MSGVQLDSLVSGAISEGAGQVQILSDGSTLAAYRADATTIGFKHSTDRVTYTLKNTYTPLGWDTATYRFGLTVDASDNIHLCWLDTADFVRYVKFTKSAGPTWTAGSVETVGAQGSGLISNPAVEAMDSGTVLVGWQAYATGVSLQARFRLRMTGGTWSPEFTEDIANPPFGAVGSSVTWAPSIARDTTGVVGTDQKFAFLIGGVGGTTAVISFKLGVKAINLTTGGVASTTIIDAAAIGGVNGNTVETFGVFSAAPGFWHGGASVYGGGGTRAYYGFKISATAYVLGPLSEAWLTASLSDAGIVYVNNRVVILESESAMPGSLYAKVIAFDDGSGTSNLSFLSRFTHDPDSTSLGDIRKIVSGSNRNGSFGHADVVLLTLDQVWIKSNIVWGQTIMLYSPGNGATVTTNNVTMAGWFFTAGSGQMHKPLYELSTSPAFTSPVRFESLHAEYMLAGPSSVSDSVLPDGVVTQGVWYARAYAVDPFGQLGPASGSSSFTVAHAPSAVVVTPKANETAAFASPVEFAWTFYDGWASDYQSAYQLVLERNDTGASILDTGKVVGAGGLAGTRNSASHVVSATYKDVPLRVKVRVWDAQDIASPFSAYNLFTLVDAPVVDIITPAAGTLSNPNVTVTWSFAASGRTQSAHQVTIALAGGTVVYNSGTVGGAATSHTPSYTLANSTDYVFSVRVYDNTSGAVSSVDSVSVSTSWSAPADTTSAEVDITTYESNGYVTITWTDATRDATFYSWQVWRTDVESGAVTLLVESRTDAENYEFHDYSVANRKAYLYDVIQTATRFGVAVPGPIGSIAQMSVGLDVLVQGDYWLVHRSDPSFNMALRHVVSDKYIPNEIERQEISLVGRGRKVDFGTEYGPKGVLSAQIRDWFNPSTGLTESARTIQKRLLMLQATKASMYLRNPFGDIWIVTMGDVDIDRVAGVGASEYVNVTIPYTGVTGPATVAVLTDVTAPEGMDIDGGTP